MNHPAADRQLIYVLLKGRVSEFISGDLRGEGHAMHRYPCDKLGGVECRPCLSFHVLGLESEMGT